MFLNTMESGDIYLEDNEQLPEGAITMFDTVDGWEYEAYFNPGD